MGGADYEVPPLTLGQLKRLRPKLKDLESGDADLVSDALCEIVATALQRNYPSTTVEQVADLLDLGNREAVMSAVLGGSGLKLGEAQAVTRTPGPTSMDSSPPLADTAIQ